MRQLVLDEEQEIHDEICLDSDSSHYLLKVLRLIPGDSFPGLDSFRNVYTLQIMNQDRAALRLYVQDKRRSAVKEKEILLYQCLPKAKKMDTIIRQSVELGVTAIIPVISQYIANLQEQHSFEKKRDRYNSIIREAVQQCGRKSIPELRETIMLTEIPCLSKTCFVFYEKALEQNTLDKYLSRDIASVSLLIGSEGGFSEEEIQDLLDKQFKCVKLGSNILRTETAAISALSAVSMLIHAS